VVSAGSADAQAAREGVLTECCKVGGCLWGGVAKEADHDAPGRLATHRDVKEHLQCVGTQGKSVSRGAHAG
jgi:hypothetical protein